jgi:hypothetical protein
MGQLLQRFEDPGTERAFLRAERAERGQAIRALIAIAVATLLSYIVINPMHFPTAGITAYTWAGGALILLMAGFFLLTRTRFYLEEPWIDLPVFIFMAGGMKWLALVLAGLSAFTGFPPHVMAMVQMAILMVFASVGFAGTFRLFLIWSFAVLALFAAWLVTRAGVSDISKVYTLTNFSTFFVFALYFNWDIDRRARKVFAANAALEAERKKTEELLHNVLPQEVAARLRAGEAVADSFSDLTAVFVDLAGFSALSKRLSPGQIAQRLLLGRGSLRRAARARKGQDDRRRLSGGGGRHGVGPRRQQGGNPVRARPHCRSGGHGRRERPSAAGADRRPYRAGRRRRHRQHAARLRLLGRHDECRQPAPGRRAAQRSRGLGSDLLPDAVDPGL